MKKNIKRIARTIVLTIVGAFSTASFANGIFTEDFFYLQPYAGADAQFRFMSFREGFGAKNFRNRYPQGNLYVGLKFCDYLGIEGGYFASADMTRQSFFTRGEQNIAVSSSGLMNGFGTSRIQGWHINAVGFAPLSETYCLTALAYIGVSQSKLTARYFIADINGLEFNETLNFTQSKTILRAGLGLQHMITDCIGVRGLVGWDDTSKFSGLRSPQDLNVLVKAKSSIVLSFGIFATI